MKNSEGCRTLTPAVDDSDESSDGSEFGRGSAVRGFRWAVRVGSWAVLLAAAAAVLVHVLPAREAPAQEAPPTARMRGSEFMLVDDAAAEEEVPRKARVFILLMGMDSIPHVDIWKAFFEGEPADSYGFLVHCKNEQKCKDQLNATGLIKFGKVVPTVFSDWCRDLVSPMLQLLKYALAQEPAPGYPVDKFAFVSTQHLPVKPLRFLSEELGKRPDDSDFCVHKSEWWMSMKADWYTQVVVCYQWSVLSRKDAVTLRHRMPDPSPHEPVAVPKVEGFGWEDMVAAFHCIDEAWIFTTLYGLAHVPAEIGENQTELPFPGFGSLWYPVWKPEGRCVYFGTEGTPAGVQHDAEWDHANQAQAALALQRIGDSSIISPPTHCDKGPDSCEIIWVIEGLGPLGQRFLRDSEFLFARKFADDALLYGYASNVFDKEVPQTQVVLPVPY